MKFPFSKKEKEIIVGEKPYIKMTVFYRDNSTDQFSYPIKKDEENTGEDIFNDFCKWFCN